LEGNPDHIAQARRGARMIALWRRTHPLERLDLRGARLEDLDGADLSGALLCGARLTGASLRGTNLSGADLASASLRRANLETANLSRAILNGSSLARANLERANLTEASLIDADMVACQAPEANFSKASLTRANLAGAHLKASLLAGADFSRANLARANLSQVRAAECQFKLANLNEASLLGADLQEADFRDAWLEDANISQASLHRADLRRARMRRADLSGSTLSEANLSGPVTPRLRAKRTYLYWIGADPRSIEADPETIGTDLRDANLTEANLSGACVSGVCFHGARAASLNLDGIRGMHAAWALETVSFRDNQGVEHLERDTLRLESACREWPERFPFAWEHIRMFGQLRLLSVSYLALVAVPIIVDLINYFNTLLRAARHWIHERDATLMGARRALDGLHEMSLGSSTALLFLSVVFISMGVLLYTVFCPPRVKEFSAEQWRYQLNRPLIHYWPHSWKFRRARIPCLLFYLMGAGLFLFVLIYKVARALANVSVGYLWTLFLVALASSLAMPALDWRATILARRQASDGEEKPAARKGP
jgi:uncharacterized protein YjbI with pentapeptide repeats